MNKQTVTIKWLQHGLEKADEYMVLLNTWFLGIFTQEDMGTYSSVQRAVARGNEVQDSWDIEGKVKLEKN